MVLFSRSAYRGPFLVQINGAAGGTGNPAVAGFRTDEVCGVVDGTIVCSLSKMVPGLFDRKMSHEKRAPGWLGWVL